MFDHCEKIIPHEINLFPLLSQPLNLFKATGRIVDLPILSENCRLIHHLLDILIDSQNPIQDLSWSLGAETGFVFDRRLVFSSLLFYFLKAPFDPSYLNE